MSRLILLDVIELLFYPMQVIMSRLRKFVEGAHTVAEIQEAILEAMGRTFDGNDYAAMETAILAPGYEGWESRALSVIKASVNDSWVGLQSHCTTLTQRYKNAIPYPGQTEEFWVDPRAYWCLKCGYRVTSMAISGICCYGQPECLRCKHEVHEPGCKKTEKKA